MGYFSTHLLRNIGFTLKEKTLGSEIIIMCNAVTKTCSFLKIFAFRRKEPVLYRTFTNFKLKIYVNHRDSARVGVLRSGVAGGSK